MDDDDVDKQDGEDLERSVVVEGATAHEAPTSGGGGDGKRSAGVVGIGDHG